MQKVIGDPQSICYTEKMNEENEHKESDSEEVKPGENSPEGGVGWCYSGKCNSKGEKTTDFRVSKANCESSGGKSWVDIWGKCHEI